MVQSTHTLVFTGDEVAKRYRSWDRGEPEREWNALVLFAPIRARSGSRSAGAPRR